MHSLCMYLDARHPGKKERIEQKEKVRGITLCSGKTRQPESG